jgi:hypothetical protein
VQGSVNNGFKGAKIFKLNSAGDAKVDSLRWFQNLDWFEPISFDQGPDGALYVVMYHGWHTATTGTHIGRLEYSGTCRPDPSTHLDRLPAAEAGLDVAAGRIQITREGAGRLELRDLRGNLVFRDDREGPREIALGPALAGRSGVHLATMVFPSGRVTRKITLP